MHNLIILIIFIHFRLFSDDILLKLTYSMVKIDENHQKIKLNMILMKFNITNLFCSDILLKIYFFIKKYHVNESILSILCFLIHFRTFKHHVGSQTNLETIGYHSSRYFI